jgi:integrase
MAIDYGDYNYKEDGIYQHKKNEHKFVFDFRVDKKRYRKTYIVEGETKGEKACYKDAKIAFLNYQSEIKKDGKVDRTITLDKFYEMVFETETQTDWKDKKKRHYKNHIQKELGSKAVSAITELQINKLLIKMEKEGFAVRTRKAMKEVLSPIFEEARKQKLRTDNPTEFLKFKLVDQKKFVIDASEKFIKLHETVMEVYKDDAFRRALFLFALIGRRKGEIFTIKWENIDFDKNIYWLRSDNTKTKKNQQFELSLNIKDALLEFRESEGLVFVSPVTGDKLQNLERQVKKIRKISGITEWSFHYSRNVIVSTLSERGMDAAYLSGILGHTDINTINKYLSINTLKGSEVGNQSISELLAGR